MLKKRLVACILLKDGLVVQSIGFNKYLVVSKPEHAVHFFNKWDVDEIIFLDISANRPGLEPSLDIVKSAAKACFIPLTFGGGIRSLENGSAALKAGADKLCINTEAVENPDFIRQASKKFGSQCIVISIDAKEVNEGYEVFSNGGKKPTGLEPTEWAKKAEELGAGEIFLNSIDRDGSKQGYDIKLLKEVVEAVTIPVIACGGVGKMQDFVDGIKKGNASAVAAANIFQYTEHSTIKAKAELFKAGIDVRLDTEATYLQNRLWTAEGDAHKKGNEA